MCLDTNIDKLLANGIMHAGKFATLITSNKLCLPDKFPLSQSLFASKRSKILFQRPLFKISNLPKHLGLTHNNIIYHKLKLNSNKKFHKILKTG